MGGQQIKTFLSSDEARQFDKLATSLEMSRYELAKKCILDQMETFEKKPTANEGAKVTGGKEPQENGAGGKKGNNNHEGTRKKVPDAFSVFISELGGKNKGTGKEGS